MEKYVSYNHFIPRKEPAVLPNFFIGTATKCSSPLLGAPWVWASRYTKFAQSFKEDVFPIQYSPSEEYIAATGHFLVTISCVFFMSHVVNTDLGVGCWFHCEISGREQHKLFSFDKPRFFISCGFGK